jgi:hypothetical protein
VVEEPEKLPLQLAGAPTLSGAPVAGQQLTATAPAVTDENGPVQAVLSWSWQRDGLAVPGNGSTYALTAADAGHVITATVLAEAAGHTSASATSAGVRVAPAQQPDVIPGLAAKLKAKKQGKVKLTVSLTAQGASTDGIAVTVKKGSKTVGTGTVRGGRVVITLKKQKAGRATYTVTSAAASGVAAASVRVSGKVR